MSKISWLNFGPTCKLLFNDGPSDFAEAVLAVCNSTVLLLLTYREVDVAANGLAAGLRIDFSTGVSAVSGLVRGGWVG